MNNEIYITLKVQPKSYQFTFEDMLNGMTPAKLAAIESDTHNTYDTMTRIYKRVPEKLMDTVDFNSMFDALRDFVNKNSHYLDTPLVENYETFYLEKKGKGLNALMKKIYMCRRPQNAQRYDSRELYCSVIEKLSPLRDNHPTKEHASIEATQLQSLVDYLNQYFIVTVDDIKGFIKSSFRRIDAPKGKFKDTLNNLKDLLEYNFFGNYHTNAYAYIKGRSTFECLKKHQKNCSRWFLKLDFSNFFTNTTPDFVKKQLKMIFPFSEIYKTPQGEEYLDKALSLCFLNEGLPQGTQVSPLLTNIIMIPIDHAISKAMREHVPHICYTRYADDIMLSSDLSFKWTEVQQQLMDILTSFEAPFSLNTSKTRYGSSAGRNWNLGLMLNKDNEITVGSEKKHILKATIHQFIQDYLKGNIWDLSDTQVLAGQLSYYRMIEKDNIDRIVQRYTEKFGISVDDVIKKILKNEI